MLLYMGQVDGPGAVAPLLVEGLQVAGLGGAPHRTWIDFEASEAGGAATAGGACCCCLACRRAEDGQPAPALCTPGLTASPP